MSNPQDHFFDLAVAITRTHADVLAAEACKLCGFVGRDHFHSAAPVVDAEFVAKYPAERTLGDVFDDRAADRWERRRDERSDR